MSVIDSFERENKRWPTRRERFECYSRECDGCTVYGWRTHGLGEPFVANDGPDVGYGCELYIEFTSSDETINAIALQALREVSDAVISKPDIPRLVKQFKSIPYDLEHQTNVPYSNEYRCNDGIVGCIVGMLNPWHPAQIENSAGKDVQFIPIKPIERTAALSVRIRGIHKCRQLYSMYKRLGAYHLFEMSVKND